MSEIVVAAIAGLSIQSFGDISEAISACYGKTGLILTEADLGPEFFALHSGLAGELFQKFINYQIPLAIVLPDFEAYGERFSELAYEHSSHPQIRFARTPAEAMAWLNS
jgi:hypothetical protein